MMLIGELKNWLSAFADDEEVAIVDCGGLSLETRTEGLALGGWPEDSDYESARWAARADGVSAQPKPDGEA